ncbi:MAG: hypothetical protein ACREK8_09095, partial [Gemmatimonadales bacterium]
MLTRREAIAQLAAFAAAIALPRDDWWFASGDPLEGSIAEYQAGLRLGKWGAVEVVTHAVDR